MHTRWVPLTTLLLALTAAACANTTDNDTAAPTTLEPAPTTAPTPTTTAAPTTTTTIVDEEAAVTAAYLAYWDAFFTVTNPGQPDSPLIDQVATGRAAERLREIAADRVATNTAYRLPEQSVASHDVAIVELLEGTATVRDCFVDDSFRQDLATGSIDDNAVQTNLFGVSLVLEDGRWRVAAPPVLLREWPGVSPCQQ